MIYTPAWAIEERLKIREIRADLAKQDSEWVKKEKLLEDYLYSVMIERGEENIKTDAGVAYKSPQTRVTMIDRQAVINNIAKRIMDFMAWPDMGGLEALQDALGPMLDLFTNHVSKEVVKAMTDAGEPPPGIEVVTFVTCNVKRSA